MDAHEKEALCSLPKTLVVSELKFATHLNKHQTSSENKPLKRSLILLQESELFQVAVNKL